jgi:hypothetical protein
MLPILLFRCLQDWQNVLREQGQTRRAQSCEICRKPWRIDRLAAAEAAALSNGEARQGGSGFRGPGARLLALARARARFLGMRILDSLNAPSLPILIFRVWRIWVLGASVCK